MEGIKWTKVKYTHSGNTLRNPFEHQLNNETQYCKIGTACGENEKRRLR
jgi:hypothetical protein